MVEILPNPVTGAREGNFIYVFTYPHPKETGERLAIVEAHIWGGDLNIYKLKDKVPMSHEEAMQFAIEHADKHGIQRIYEQCDPD